MTLEQLLDKMAVQDVYLYNEHEEVYVRYQHRDNTYHARLAGGREFQIQPSTDTVMHALFGRVEVTKERYETA